MNVPYHTLPASPEKIEYDCRGYTLPDGRTVGAGFAADGSRVVVITRPLENGDTSELKFAITKEAAHLLVTVLLELEDKEKANEAN